MEAVDHPDHYGGKDNPYEVIRVIEAWKLGFNLGNVLKYIGRPTKGQLLEDLKKAQWYLKREIERMEADQFKAEAELPPYTYVGPGYDFGPSIPRPVRCISAWGCTGGYHGRTCPLRKDVP